MKKTFFKISMLFFCAGLALTACKTSDGDVTPKSENQKTAGSDDTRAQNENESGATDAEIAMSSNSSTQRTTADIIMGASIDESKAASEKKLVINYDGTTNVGGRKRSGSIIVQLTSGAHWSDQNTVMTLTYNSYKSTRVNDGTTITLNGTTKITNTSGGSVATMTALDTRTRRVRSSNMEVIFANGSQRNWSIAKTRTITCQLIGSAYTVKTMGDTTIEAHGDATHHVAAWGTTRFGTSFYTVIPDNNPITWISASCSFVPVSGEASIQGLLRTVTIKYGVDSNGEEVTSATCAYGVKMTWLGVDGSTKTAVDVY
ncbi:MAG: hypothetical protein H7282_01495 [Cytophagaceae bacterium]|nr:hypothetical protein [Cytophagaceae bacterium]